MILQHITRFLACSVCFGDPESLMSKGLTMGVLALLAVLVAVLALFAKFFLNVRRRSKDMSV